MEALIQDIAGWGWLYATLDVIVVAWLIYRILLLIKGTRAVQMLIGITLVILVFFVSKTENLDLLTLNWILDKFIASFIVILVVIFQADIRRGLTQVGRNPILAGGWSSEGGHFYEEIVRGTVALANHRLGALIAVERDADLSPYMDEGVRIHSQVSKELIYAVFLKTYENPLHDGAMIIRKGQIAAAGCFLPLTANPKVDRALGTRHRAAIGLSEETDATVIVVSEETGTISIATNGELRRNFDQNSLREELQRVFGATARPTLWRRIVRPRAS
ncbi:MAG: TIGR00159 family protein [Myxococcales bacterium]